MEFEFSEELGCLGFRHSTLDKCRAVKSHNVDRRLTSWSYSDGYPVIPDGDVVFEPVSSRID